MRAGDGTAITGDERSRQFPGVTILKPVMGTDVELRGNLASFFDLEYAGEVELIFAVPSKHDPAFGVAAAVAEEHSHTGMTVRIEVGVIDGRRRVRDVCGVERRIGWVGDRGWLKNDAMSRITAVPHKGGRVGAQCVGDVNDESVWRVGRPLAIA